MLGDYLTLDELKASVGGEWQYSRDADYQRAITSASRWVDDHCARHFWLEPAPLARLVRATTRAVITPGDFPDPSTATVEVDEHGDGVFIPFPQDLWQAEPFTRYNGWPCERITPTTSESWPVDAHRPRVKVTARWGWDVVPPLVVDATRLIAVEILMGTAIAAGDERAPTSLSGPFEFVDRLLERYAPMDRRDRRVR